MTVQFHESPFPHTIKIAHSFEVGTGKLWGFRTYWSYNPTVSTPSNADMQALALLASNTWGSACAAMCHPQIVLRNTVATDLTTSTSAIGEHGASVAGTRSGSALSPGQTCLVNYLTQVRYRGGKGRTNLPFGNEADVDSTGANWTTAATTAFSTAWGNYRNAILGSTNATFYFQVVASYFKGSQPNDSPSIWAPKYIPLPRVDSSGQPAPQAYPVVGFAIPQKIAFQKTRVATG